MSDDTPSEDDSQTPSSDDPRPAEGQSGSAPPPPPGSNPPPAGAQHPGQAPPPPPPGAQPPGQAPPPPPSQQWGYAEQPGTPANRYSIGASFNYGWTRFQANIGPIVLVALAIFVAVVVLQIISFSVSGGLLGLGADQMTVDPVTGEIEGGGGGFFTASFFVTILFYLLTMVVSLVIGLAIVHGALDITYGRQLSLKSMFTGNNVLQAAIASVVISIATWVGAMLCVIPGLVVSFFTFFTLFFIVDKQMPAMEAIMASVKFVNRNLGTMIGFFLASILAYIVGALLCGIGLLAAIPVIIIAQAYTYRSLQGEQVA